MVTRRVFLTTVGFVAVGGHAMHGIASAQKAQKTKLATTTLTISGML